MVRSGSGYRCRIQINCFTIPRIVLIKCQFQCFRIGFIWNDDITFTINKPGNRLPTPHVVAHMITGNESVVVGKRDRVSNIVKRTRRKNSAPTSLLRRPMKRYGSRRLFLCNVIAELLQVPKCSLVARIRISDNITRFKAMLITKIDLQTGKVHALV